MAIVSSLLKMRAAMAQKALDRARRPQPITIATAADLRPETNVRSTWFPHRASTPTYAPRILARAAQARSFPRLQGHRRMRMNRAARRSGFQNRSPSLDLENPIVLLAQDA